MRNVSWNVNRLFIGAPPNCGPPTGNVLLALTGRSGAGGGGVCGGGGGGGLATKRAAFQPVPSSSLQDEKAHGCDHDGLPNPRGVS